MKHTGNACTTYVDVSICMTKNVWRNMAISFQNPTMTAPWIHRQLLCGQTKLKWDSVFFLSTRRVSHSEIEKWHQNLRSCLWLIFWNYRQCFWSCEPAFSVCVQ